MRQSLAAEPRRRGVEGFSLVELMVVTFIIATMVAVSIPAISSYIRNYKIRGAAQQLASEIQAARMKAIMNNVNLGVTFAVLSSTDYQFALEDDLDPQTSPNWAQVSSESWTTTFAPPQASTRRALPDGVLFDASCSNQTASPAVPNMTPNAIGFRFNRIGAWCGFCATCTPACLPIPGAPTTPEFVYSDTAGGTGATICLKDRKYGITSWVSITSGGRVRTGW